MSNGFGLMEVVELILIVEPKYKDIVRDLHLGQHGKCDCLTISTYSHAARLVSKSGDPIFDEASLDKVLQRLPDPDSDPDLVQELRNNCALMRLNPDRGDLEFESKIRQSLEASRRVQNGSNAAAEMSESIPSPTVPAIKKKKKSLKPAAPPAVPSPSKKAKTKRKKGFDQDTRNFGQEREVGAGFGVGGHLHGGRDVPMDEVFNNSLHPTGVFAHAGAAKKRHGPETVKKELAKKQKKAGKKKKK
jgi:hypothetical protein